MCGCALDTTIIVAMGDEGIREMWIVGGICLLVVLAHLGSRFFYGVSLIDLLALLDAQGQEVDRKESSRFQCDEDVYKPHPAVNPGDIRHPLYNPDA